MSGLRVLVCGGRSYGLSGKAIPGSPVLFLDIDGVLNCTDFFRKTKKPHPRAICAERMALLNQVIAETGCVVTVSSTWRMDNDCRAILRRRGFKGRFSRDWRTPWLRSDKPDLVRGDEIADWLSRNTCLQYAIIDDDSDMLDEQRSRFVQTSHEFGLTADHAKRLIALLSQPPRARAAGIEVREIRASAERGDDDARVGGTQDG